MLSLVAAPSLEPVSLAEVRLHLRVDDVAEDALIDSLRVAAREYVENFTGRKLITQTWDQKQDGFCGHCIELPFAPLISVTSISYVDNNGDTQVWPSPNYTVDAPTGPFAMPGRIVPAYGVTWPSTRDVINAVTVRFVTGYGSTVHSVPYLLRAALKEYTRAHFDRGCGSEEERDRLKKWVDSVLWSFKFSC
jgi:uncharacterized phiE125 gp8 family phage protein